MSDICVHTVNKYYLFQVSDPLRLMRAVYVIGGLQCSVPIHKRRIYFPCLTFSFLRGRIPVIHPKFHQNASHMTSILWVHHMIQLVHIMHYNDNVNLSDCFVRFPSRTIYGKSIFPIVLGKLGTLRYTKRLRKRKLGTLSCRFVH